ncbi:DUF1189 domain-containing protein [Robertmurraya sp.]|jgi:hypothetical protein|uniref:DUF1189 domain-containing protein n=1 Tax=Robertmurraya sp. TaxID=2837525 RepID=UPI0037045CA9
MNIFQQLFKSLYSPKDIAITRFQGIGKTILYVFLLTLVSVIPTISYVSSAINNGIETAAHTVDKELPDFSIENGELTADQEEPIYIEDADFTIIFDSTGEVSENDLESYENAFALLQNEFVLIAGGTLDTYDYSTLSDLNITKDSILEVIHSVDGLLAVIIPVLALTIYIFSSGIKFIEITILALFGLFIKNVTSRNLPYRQLWRLSAYSVTLPTIFFTIMEAFQTNVPNGFLINWFVSIIMLYLTVREIPQKAKK